MNAQSNRPSLRVWPGVAIVIVQWFLWAVLPLVAPEAALIAMLGGVGGMLFVLAWWLFYSRAPWADRIGAIVFMVLALIVTRFVVDASIRGGMMGMMPYFYPIPGLSLALVAGAVLGRRLSAGSRRVVMAVAILIGCGVWTMARTDGILGGHAQLAWRWTPTAEARLLARADDALPALPPAPVPAPSTTPNVGSAPNVAAGLQARGSAGPKPGGYEVAHTIPADWPGFRGPNRDSVIHGVHIDTDWVKSPPVEMWRRPIGPGWSSFAVQGDLLYTQEQRGEEEIVACYKVSTGAPVWMHRDKTRFWESNGGAGPRGTPTLLNGRVYAFGATGILNALDAATGAAIWSRNAATDTKRVVPTWGFASSPLVLDDSVVIGVSGTLASYDLATGKPRWVGPQHGGSYSSPQLMAFDGVPQIVLLSAPGAVSVSPADGTLLWEHTWEGGAIIQPGLTADGDILINAMGGTGGIGLRRLAVHRAGAAWNVEERWTSTGLKPYFNDFVVHKGYAYGFDGSILSCIDLADGKRKWKGGRFGQGQLVLLADQDVLLVLSEEGELGLVSATPDQFTELARIPVMEGKTWNHPVLVRDILLVRNGEEMVAFRLAK